MDELDNNLLDIKEKRILEFLETEKVEWGDPTEKCFNYYNQRKRIMLKKNSSCNSNLNLISSNELDMDSSPLLMRRKNKANTLCSSLGLLTLKESFSLENLTTNEKMGKNISPTKFKWISELK